MSISYSKTSKYSPSIRKHANGTKSLDKKLFTPGPLSTTASVKEVMLKDIGSREIEFIEIIKDVRNRILEVAGVSQQLGYECVLMQGSGTFAVESVISSTIPPNGKLMVIINGAYGKRILDMAKIHNIDVVPMIYSEGALPDLVQIRNRLHEGDITHVAVVHCETTSGILNPINEIVSLVKQVPSRKMIVDAMSSFGGVEFSLASGDIDFLISSSNKCVQGVPGLGIIIAKKSSLLESIPFARTLSLNLHAQWKGLEENGQFRFTPPTHVILALKQALVELSEETLKGRVERYKANQKILVDGMKNMGFKEYLPSNLQSHIISSFRYPESPNFNFEKFYAELTRENCIIYPGKVTDANCFRIGTIGDLHPKDIENLLEVIQTVKESMRF